MSLPAMKGKQYCTNACGTSTPLNKRLSRERGVSIRIRPLHDNPRSHTPVPGKAPVFERTTIPRSLAMYPFMRL